MLYVCLSHDYIIHSVTRAGAGTRDRTTGRCSTASPSGGGSAQTNASLVSPTHAKRENAREKGFANGQNFLFPKNHTNHHKSPSHKFRYITTYAKTREIRISRGTSLGTSLGAWVIRSPLRTRRRAMCASRACARVLRPCVAFVPPGSQVVRCMRASVVQDSDSSAPSVVDASPPLERAAML